MIQYEGEVKAGLLNGIKRENLPREVWHRWSDLHLLLASRKFSFKPDASAKGFVLNAYCVCFRASTFSLVLDILQYSLSIQTGI